ncbi:MAG: Rpn family recombination-promoting nuclease/putative transposase [Lachnospiraceae bacterium]|nr:Rpn family recombination-promoting nuclease/putative transposase [Lachnospiraceae bacterium]
MDTDLRNLLASLGDESTQYDTIAKQILSRRSVLSHILAATVDEFKDIPPAEIEGYIDGKIHIGNVPVEPGLTNKAQTENGDRIVGLNTIHEEQFEGIAVFDIIFYVRIKDELSKIIINVEAQKDEPSGYDILNRAIFYVSRLVSSQKERDFTGKHYNDLQRVYSIWICMNMDECIWNYIHLTNDAIMANHEWKGKLDMLNIVLLGLPNELPEQGEKYKLHRMLSALFSLGLTSDERIDILENEYSIPARTEFREELNAMCNLSQGILERGIEQGESLGELKKAKETASKLYKKGWDLSDIAELLNYSKEVISGWLGLS